MLCRSYVRDGFLVIHKGGRNIREFLTPPTVGGGLAKSTPSRAGVIPAPRQGYQHFSQSTFSSDFLGSGIQNLDSLQSNSYVEEKLGKCPSINCSRFFLYSRFLRQLILIHNKPLEIPPSPSPPTSKCFPRSPSAERHREDCTSGDFSSLPPGEPRSKLVTTLSRGGPVVVRHFWRAAAGLRETVYSPISNRSEAELSIGFSSKRCRGSGHAHSGLTSGEYKQQQDKGGVAGGRT